jgi:hypothetical protein
MQGLRVKPVERLGGGRMVVAERTAEALGLDAQIDHPAEDGQMAQQPRLVHAVMVRPQRREVVLVCMPSTVRMRSPSFVNWVSRTRASGISSGTEMIWMLGHLGLSFESRASHGGILHYLDPKRNPCI